MNGVAIAGGRNAVHGHKSMASFPKVLCYCYNCLSITCWALDSTRVSKGANQQLIITWLHKTLPVWQGSISFWLRLTCFLCVSLPFLPALTCQHLFRGSQSICFTDRVSPTYCHFRSRDLICEKGSAAGTCLHDSLVLLPPTSSVSASSVSMEWPLGNTAWRAQAAAWWYKDGELPFRMQYVC